MSKKKATGASAASPDTSRREQLRQKQLEEAKRARTMRIVSIAAAVLGLLLIAVVATVLIQKNKDDKTVSAAQSTPKNANADKSGIRVFPEAKPKEGAPTVALYLDYQCPNCKHLEAQMGPWFKSLADKGEIDFEHRTMNFMDINLKNDASTRAAVAAACSDNQGVYEQFHQNIFANQETQEIPGSEGYSDQLLRVDLPSQVGLSGQKLADFQACYDTRATKEFIKGTNDKAAEAKVTGTPAIHVNGKAVDMEKNGARMTDEQGLLEVIKETAAA
ncbi:DsbA family protein [Luteococcus sp.]|uniref:DsbA family protein n=1 Tax=Luteococcus sp. TaxID=1969402 RepID=UPI003735B88C